MSSHPFYSPEIRTSLLSIVQADRSSTSTLSSPPLAANPAVDDRSAAAFGAAIRGKRRAGGDSGSSVSASGSKSYSSSSSSSSASDRDQDGSDDADATRDDAPAIIPRAANEPRRTAGRNTNKRSNNKRCKDETLSKASAPSVVLPLPTDSQLALHVPTVLLPNRYLRDNPHVSSVAGRLLTAWEALHGKKPARTKENPTIVIVLLQSGRFASAVYSLTNNSNNNSSNNDRRCPAMTMLAHKTSTRYTIRKGQGGSQSNFDQAKSKAKSMGAQLRREGERQLRNDVLNTWKEWKTLGLMDRCEIAFVSCPKGMRRDYLYGGENSAAASLALLEKGDERWRNIPLDVGRPTLEAVGTVMECVFRCHVREMTDEEKKRVFLSVEEEEVGDNAKLEQEGTPHSDGGQDESTALTSLNELQEQQLPTTPPYTPLHDAVIDGDLCRLTELLNILDQSETQDAETPSPVQSFDIDTQAGPDLQTPLHLASSSTHENAPVIVNALLLRGRANPCAMDARGRPPYFLASSDKLRETFRLARGELGEDYCAWDNGAKVGPALTAEDVELKKAKELEKKRRQRARQKEKKAAEKASQLEAAAKLQREEEEKKQEEDAKRVRDGLKPKATTATNVCDFCQTVAKGKRRSQMFQRLDYAYCSTECVKRHQRELAAAAALARMGN